jgi:hypothetical protein
VTGEQPSCLPLLSKASADGFECEFLGVLPPADMARVMQHPAQRATTGLVAALIEKLREGFRVSR